MGYYINLKNISIDDYKRILNSADLIPSWMVLKENIDENFDIIKELEIQDLDALQETLKTKKRLHEFSEKSGLSEDYLIVLRRMINGYHPKPNKIIDLPDIEEDVVERLEAIGIKNTLQLYCKVLTAEDRDKLSQSTGINKGIILRITRLADLSRIRWVNHTFAYVLLEAGYESALGVANADYRNMYEEIKQLNEEREIYKANIGINDMKRCVESAKDLDFEIEY